MRSNTRSFTQPKLMPEPMPEPMSRVAGIIAVDEIRHINKGALKATADITINKKAKINGLRVIQQAGQHAWVSMPQIEVKSQDGGKSKYYPVVEILDPKLKIEITAAVLAAWELEQGA